MTDNIKPDHYRKGEIDLYEAFSQIFPHNEYRAGMQMIAMRYMFRDKIDRVEDLNKSIYTLERLKEKEIEHAKQNSKSLKEAFGGIKTKTAGQYLDEIYYQKSDLLKRLWKERYCYLARDENGELCAFEGRPKKYEDMDFWETGAIDFSSIKQDNFPEVKWTDVEPTKISDLLATYENGGENGDLED